MIVETLFERGYLEGKSIQATPLGMKLIASLEKYSPIIIDENLTRIWKKKMEDIQFKNDNRLQKEKAVLADVERIIGNIAREFKEKNWKSVKRLLKARRNSENSNANRVSSCPARSVR